MYVGSRSSVMTSDFRSAQRMMRISLRRDAFDFRDSDQRNVTQEQQEEREEQSKCSEILQNIDNCRAVVTPVRRNELAMQRSHDNHEAFEPHADVHEDRQHEH